MHISLRKSQIVSYITYLLIFVWILFAGYLYYYYLISQTQQAPTKGGTLIEGVTDKVTYLPKIKAFDDRFYKSFLFRRCVVEQQSGGQTTYEPDLCDIITNDNKTFLVKLKENIPTWSDGAPISINDLMFTYEGIMQKNVWNLPQYKGNNNIVIQKSAADTLTITFSQSSKENMNFFTDFILPAHILKGWSRDDYTKNFSSKLVTNGCAKLTNSRDQKSLIFDLTSCSNTRLKYYQVKNYTLQEMQKDPGIMDIYIGDGSIPGYNSGNVMTNNYVGLFFNMQIGKLNIYGRKNMIALVNKYLYLPENKVPLVKEHFLFDGFTKAVTDKTTITNIGISHSLSGIQTLPKTLQIHTAGSGQTTNQLYTLGQIEEPFTIKLDDEKNRKLQKVVTQNGIQIPIESHIIGDASITLRNNENIFPGLNILTFFDEKNEKKGSISIYYKTTHQISKDKLIHIVYFAGNSVHKHIANTIQNILDHEGLSDYFFFDGKESIENYNDTLSKKQYDITFQTLTLGTKKDISPLLLTDDPLVNASLYVNANLASQIKQYFQSNLQTQYNIAPIITKLYTTDLPFFVMGKELKTIYWRPELELPTKNRFDDLSIRNDLLTSIVLVTKPQVTKADILNRKGFIKFIIGHIGK